jgi:hypothetical protein
MLGKIFWFILSAFGAISATNAMLSNAQAGSWGYAAAAGLFGLLCTAGAVLALLPENASLPTLPRRSHNCPLCHNSPCKCR